jgi:hypothetical protein
MTKKNIQCSFVSLGRMTALWAQGWCRFDGVAGSGMTWRCGPGDGVGCQHRGLGNGAGCTMSQVGEDDVVAGSETVPRAWGRGLRGRRCHQLRSGKMEARKGLYRGQERW